MVGTKRHEYSILESQNHDTVNSKLAQDVLMRLRPYAYTEGELQQVMLNAYVMCILNETGLEFSNI